MISNACGWEIQAGNAQDCPMTAIAYIEKQMRPHDPDLYRNLGDANRVSGLGAVDAAAVAQYEQQGFLLIRPVISDDYILRAGDELRSMTEAYSI